MTVNLNTTNPLSFLQWKRHYGDISEASELSILYNNYLVEWKEQKQDNTTTNTDYVKDIYTQFLKNLNLSTLNNDVAKFLSLVDVDDIYELELSVHYFVQIIKDQVKNIKGFRDEAKFTPTKNKLKASKLGIQKYLKNFIIRLLNNKEFIRENTNINLSDINIQKIANNLKINLNTYVSDNQTYDLHNIDKNLTRDIKIKVLHEVTQHLNKKGTPPNVIQALSVNKNGKKLKIITNSISSPESILGINQSFNNFDRLPVRYFRGEVRNLQNLKFTHEKGLIEKYISNDLYLLDGDKTSATLDKIFNHKNTTGNLSQRYNPNLALNLTSLTNNEIFPRQLSFKNTGITNFHSCGLTFTINMSAFNGANYIVPNPYKYEPGVRSVGYIRNSRTKEIIRNIKLKQRTPLIFKAKNAQYKNPDQKTGVDFYNNKILRNYGYQSKENSLDYSHTGINKKEDNISFWENDPSQITWRNTDTYPISVLNVYPESDRLEDLLITNKTGVKLRSDIYGNEFFFIKPIYPKRVSGAAYNTSTTSSTTTACTTAAEYYDGLFFNTLLSAISSTQYEAEGTLYSSVTGMYDTFITSHIDPVCGTHCSVAIPGDQFSAPLTGFDSCTRLHTEALSCGSVSATSAIDCGPFISHPGNSTDLMTNYFTDTTVPYYTIDTSVIYTSSTTTYEANTTNNYATSALHLFDQNYVSAGEIYVRNVHTQVIEPLSSVFTNMFNKHDSVTKAKILTDSNIVDFDIMESTIYVQTSAETLTELYTFKDGVFQNGASSKSIVT